MKLKIKMLFWAITILVIASCNSQYCPSLDRIEMVGEIDFQTVFLSDCKSKDVSLGLLGITGVRYCDSLLVVTTSGEEKFVHLFGRQEFNCLGNFFAKGRGPNELPFPLYGSELSLGEEAGSCMMRFVDQYTRRFLEMNISESIEEGAPVLQEYALELKDELFTSLPLDGSSCYMKRMANNGTALERYVWKRPNIEYMSKAMNELNSYRVDKNDGYSINLLSAIVGYDRGRKLIVEAMSLLNIINVYSVDGKEGFTLCYGQSMPDVRTLAKSSPMLKTYHAGISLCKDYFSVMYIDERDNGTRKEIHGYSWDGRPLFRIPIPSDIIRYDMDGETGSLLLVDDEDHVKEYIVGSLLTGISI